ncbi:hypothetical protein ACFVXW_32265 [Streptomyces sp. NPDC058251]|uniref:hypothetical protein n=1 Tax=unclassified Streptomyces TaxID=2593676 RepID=UPI0033C5D8DA
MNHPFRSPRPPAEAERLREVFAEAAYDVTPSAVPLAAIEREGRRRGRRRTTAVLGAACGALLVPLAVVVLRDGAPAAPSEPSDRVKPPAASTGTASPSPSPSPSGRVRVVTPGERVQVAPGTKIWLAEDGKHWLEPGAPEAQFRSVTDGNLDLSAPGVGLQESGQQDGTSFLSGIFHGPGKPARVEVRTRAGNLNGTALTLPGNPGWGVWYALVKVPHSAAPGTTSTSVTRKVTVYDAAGGVLASQEFGP